MAALTRPSRRWLTAGLVGGALFAGPAWTTGDPVVALDLAAGSVFEDVLGADDADGLPGGGELGEWNLAAAGLSDAHGRPHGGLGPLPPELPVDDEDPAVAAWADGPGGVAVFVYRGAGREAGDAVGDTPSDTVSSVGAGVAFATGATADVPHPGQTAGSDPFFAPSFVAFAAGSQSGTWALVAHRGPAAAVDKGTPVRETTQPLGPFDAHILADLGSADDGGADVLSAFDGSQDPGGAVSGGSAAPLDMEAILVAGFAQGPVAQVAPGGAGPLPGVMVVPEPASLALVGLGLGLCGLLRRRLRHGSRAA